VAIRSYTVPQRMCLRDACCAMHVARCVLRDACCGTRQPAHVQRVRPSATVILHDACRPISSASPFTRTGRWFELNIDGFRRLRVARPHAFNAFNSIANVAKIALARAGFVRGTENEKRPLAAAVLVEVGGGGENRTRVRKPSAVGTTCLVSSFGSRSPDAGGQAAGEPVTLL
jgi:hypothetical protein